MIESFPHSPSSQRPFASKVLPFSPEKASVSTKVILEEITQQLEFLTNRKSSPFLVEDCLATALQGQDFPSTAAGTLRNSLTTIGIELKGLMVLSLSAEPAMPGAAQPDSTAHDFESYSILVHKRYQANVLRMLTEPAAASVLKQFRSALSDAIEQPDLLEETCNDREQRFASTFFFLRRLKALDTALTLRTLDCSDREKVHTLPEADGSLSMDFFTAAGCKATLGNFIRDADSLAVATLSLIEHKSSESQYESLIAIVNDARQLDELPPLRIIGDTAVSGIQAMSHYILPSFHYGLDARELRVVKPHLDLNPVQLQRVTDTLKRLPAPELVIDSQFRNPAVKKLAQRLMAYARG